MTKKHKIEATMWVYTDEDRSKYDAAAKLWHVLEFHGVEVLEVKALEEVRLNENNIQTNEGSRSAS